jgi:hypothetical protein
MGKRYLFVEIAIAVSSRVHEYELDWLFWLVCLDGTAQSSSGVGYKPARRSEYSFEIQVMTKARGYGVTTTDMLGQLDIVQI